MIPRLIAILCWGGPLCLHAQMLVPLIVEIGFGKPALISTSELAGFDALPEDRRKLIEAAIALARNSPWLP